MPATSSNLKLKKKKKMFFTYTASRDPFIFNKGIFSIPVIEFNKIKFKYYVSLAQSERERLSSFYIAKSYRYKFGYINR